MDQKSRLYIGVFTIAAGIVLIIYALTAESTDEHPVKDKEILILDKLSFDNWIKIINSSSYVITPECGCTHIASISDCKLCVIYDADNLPDMISNEYAPWKKSYTKLLSNDKKLEEKILSFAN